MHVVVAAGGDETAGARHRGELSVEDFSVVDGARRDRERAHPACAVRLEPEADAAIGAAQRARQFGSAGALEERQVLGRGAVIHVGGRRERAELERERREAGVRDPRVIDARRAFGAAAAEFEQQAIVEIARDGAFDAEARAAEIEAVTEIARGVVFAIRQSRPPSRGGSPWRADLPCLRRTSRRRAARWREPRIEERAVGSRDGRPVVAEREFRRLGSGDFLRFAAATFDWPSWRGERLELRLLRFEQFGLRIELRRVARRWRRAVRRPPPSARRHRRTQGIAARPRASATAARRVCEDFISASSTNPNLFQLSARLRCCAER